MKNTVIIILILFLPFYSCNSFLEEYSQDLARVESVSDLDELLLGGVYYPAGYVEDANSGMSFVGSPFNVFIHFMSDELKQNERTDYANNFGDFFGYFTWQRQVGIDVQGVGISSESDCWDLAYEYINVANMIIDELPEVEAANATEANDKIRIEGETYFLRALYYFTLVNLYAPPYAPSTAATDAAVPLKLTSYIEDRPYSLNTVAEVYEQIIADLNRAEECLAQTERKSVYRADITAVYLLKSRVYLYMQDYANARKYAEAVLERNDALLDLNFYTEMETEEGKSNVFTASSSEVIFSMGGHFLSNYMFGDTDREYQFCYYISEDLANVFAEDDLRKTYYIRNGSYGYVYNKVYWGLGHYGTGCDVSDNFLFRTSEAYLNLAEAAALGGDEATAKQALGELQAKRFKTPPTIVESGNALIDLIREERQRELCLEGHRWYDLRRYTVCEQYPWSKPYRHAFTEFDFMNNEPTRTRVYELEEYDAAYTLALPKEVTDFQNTLGSNERPDRAPVEVINY